MLVDVDAVLLRFVFERDAIKKRKEREKDDNMINFSIPLWMSNFIR